ncbi:MAG TPA: hypothetical protein VM369_00845 [Candidatus Binatia bacterium]|nr:hypothetical protein [Candidatus Binatia bacterium]
MSTPSRHAVARLRAAPVSPQRDAQQRAWAAAPSIRERFPTAREFAIQLTFRDPAGVHQPSAFRRVFEPSMQAHFTAPCVMRGCDGHFDLDDAVAGLFRDARGDHTGTLQCRGRRDGADCGLELNYRLELARRAS